MDNAKQADLLKALELLPIHTLEVLYRSAEQDWRTPVGQLIWVIETYGSGRLYDMGDDPVTRRITLGASDRSSQDSETVRVAAFRPPPPRPTPRADER